MQPLLTAGEFARLARTTKRTVLWYGDQGILLPHKVEDSGYRFYRPQQIIDFQGILLMRRLGFSLEDIKSYLAKGRSLQDMFEQKRALIEQHIAELQRMLADTDRYYHNLDATGTLVQPAIKTVPSFTMYYLDREGPYARIKEYAVELQACFADFPADATRLTAFVDNGYQPQKAKMKIGVVYQPGLRPKPGVDIHKEIVPSYQALSYTHHGSTLLLSLLWQELGKYRRKHRLAMDTRLPFADIEFYVPDPDMPPPSDPEDIIVTELHLPVLSD